MNQVGPSSQLPRTEIIYDAEIIDISDTHNPQNPQNPRITKNILYKYEATRILGARATVISKGGEHLVDADGETDPLEFARLELNARRIPIVVRRYLPNGTYEDWRLQDLK